MSLSPPLPLNLSGEKVSPVGASWLVYDLETVNDPDVPPPEPKFEMVAPSEWATVEGFPSPAQCQVVAAGACALDENFRPMQLILFGRGEGEAVITRDFARYMWKAENLGWVTFNGRGFDVPVLIARLMRHGWPLPCYFQGRDLRYRYSKPEPGAHVDLCDQLSDQGGGRKGSLLHYCRSMGLPGKLEEVGDGSSVAEWYAKKMQAQIDAYCLLDVVQETFLFQRFMLLCGHLDREAYKALVRETFALFEATPILSPLFSADINKRKLFLEEG